MTLVLCFHFQLGVLRGLNVFCECERASGHALFLCPVAVLFAPALMCYELLPTLKLTYCNYLVCSSKFVCVLEQKQSDSLRFGYLR